VIAASGARYRRLDVDRLERFEGVSVHYAATEVEAQRCKGEDVAVVGGGNSAGQAALYLAGRTRRRVYLLIRGAALNKSMSRYLVKRVTETENVELLANTEVRELTGRTAWRGSWSRTAARVRAGHSGHGASSSSSVRRPTPAGSKGPLNSTSAASS
jgi:thioredoxin reductase (NADPH)